jgi:hypothetical protein
VGVMTKNFVSAAELMCRVLGMPGYPFAVIGHPISSASDEQLAECDGDIDVWATQNIDSFYTDADNPESSVTLEWEDEFKADLDFPEAEVRVDVT